MGATVRTREMAMPTEIPVLVQTTYAELTERAHLARLQSDFDPAGTFLKKERRGRNYWYFRSSMAQGERSDKYIGPDSPELHERIRRHAVEKNSYRQRRTLVSSLLHSGLKGPDARTGRILEALEAAGVFRMRGVVVGTVAYQTYAGLLGMKLSTPNTLTQDLDVAQFKTISIAVEDQVEISLLDVLRTVEPTTEPVPETFNVGATWRYAIGDKYRVEILTPNRGPDDDSLVHLPALQTDAKPLRHLDFLIYREVQAVVLHGAGVAVNVPAPERYCLHKLIVSRRRADTAESQTKARKDRQQASELILALAEQRPYELRDVWEDLQERGPKWRQLVAEAFTMLDKDVRDRFEQVVGSIKHLQVNRTSVLTQR
jgi:hypothetical protein